MRKLKLQVQISIDGFVAGPNGEMDWMVWDWDDSIKKYVSDLTATVDCIVMGRNLALGFIPYWENVASNSDDPQYPFGKIMTDTPKVVFTKTLDKSPWINTEIAKGELTDEINKLKNNAGKEIIVYGGATFVSSLIKAGLIDELHLFVNPTAIGKGMSIFNALEQKQNFKLIESIGFDCGINVIAYQKK